MANIICSGFGGQGVLTAGLILINAGVANGQHVTWSPSYGSEMRGGTANCSVVISDEEIGSPYVTEIDYLIALNEPSIDKFEDQIKPGGKLFINSSIIGENRSFREDIDVYYVNATEMANSIENPRGANLVVLGSLIKATKLFEKDLFAQTLNQYFAKKGKHFPKNIECLNMGYDAV